MTAAEIRRLVKIALSLDIRRIKLTGGEPLLREDILHIVGTIAELKGLKDLSMTTNGTLLTTNARGLGARGLMRVNVSLPSLKPDVYETLMGGSLEKVKRGIKAAVQAGLNPVKVNMLVLAGVNEGEIPVMIKYTESVGALLQLIELEPVNLSETYYERYHYSLEKVEETFVSQASSVETRFSMQNRRVYRLQDGVVEVVRPIENTEFCAHCTRLRITSDGKLKPCLMINTNLVDVLSPLRKGATEDELRKIFFETCTHRKPYYKTPIHVDQAIN
jgi:cyclic pyranopterin phosphate synthase